MACRTQFLATGSLRRTWYKFYERKTASDHRIAFRPLRGHPDPFHPDHGHAATKHTSNSAEEARGSTTDAMAGSSPVTGDATAGVSAVMLYSTFDLDRLVIYIWSSSAPSSPSSPSSPSFSAPFSTSSASPSSSQFFVRTAYCLPPIPPLPTSPSAYQFIKLIIIVLDDAAPTVGPESFFVASKASKAC